MSKAYKLYDVESRKTVVSRDVIFEENGSITELPPQSNSIHIPISEMETIVSIELKNEMSDAPIENGVLFEDNTNFAEKSWVNVESSITGGDHSESASSDHIKNETSETDIIIENTTQAPHESADNINPGVRRSTRPHHPPPTWWKPYAAFDPNTQSFLARDVNILYQQATSGAESQFWKFPIADEINCLVKINTWCVVPRPKNQKVLKNRWVFRIKDAVNDPGKVTEKPKARLVALEFEQVQGVDYDDTFAPVVKFASIRSLSALVAHWNIELHQMDVVTAFLNGEVQEDIYIEIPEGIEYHVKFDCVVKFNKALYGLKQAPLCWNKKIDPFLIERMGFEKCPGDPCLYVRIDLENSKFMAIAFYVDDLLWAGNDMKTITWMKREFNRQFEMKDLGEARMCLGMEIERNRKTNILKLSQRNYKQAVLKRFSMDEFRTVPTPIEEPKDTSRYLDVETKLLSHSSTPYREAIRSLMYLMIGS